MMWTILAIVAGFTVIWVLLWLCDIIAYHRGLGGAHPLSPAVAWALLLGTTIMLGLVIGGISLDRAAEKAAIRSLSNPGGSE